MWLRERAIRQFTLRFGMKMAEFEGIIHLEYEISSND